MFWFRACPKCLGDLLVKSDRYGPFRECVQCGLIQDIDTANQILDGGPMVEDASLVEGT